MLKKLIFVFVFYFPFTGFCQSNKPAGPVIQTPNTNSIGLYGEVPVTYFTGLPSVNIPVYTIQERGLNFPISLSYHAQGFRPEAHPSWVGSNWALNFGGVITRKMNKFPDEWNSPDYNIFGYYYTYNRLNTFNWSSTDTLLDLSTSNPNYNQDLDRLDREPDEFTFNFLGYSGKFFLDHLGNWRVQCNKNIKVIFNPTDIVHPFFNSSMPGSSNFPYFRPKVFSKFTLVDDQGIQYVFGDNGSNDGIEYSSSITPPGFNYRVWMIASSWNLVEIKWPDNTGSLSINYERGPFQSSFQYFESKNGFYVKQCDQPKSFESKGISGNITWPVYAKSISTSSGVVVDFKFSKSNELSYPTSTYFEVFRDELGRLPSQQSPQQGIPLEYFNFMQSAGSVPYYSANGIYADGVISSNKFVWFKLDSLTISNWDYSNNMAKTAFKRVVLSYKESPYERLKLLSVKFKGSAPGNESQDYGLTYNDYGSAAPGYVTDLTDHWGFANNRLLKREPTYGGYDWYGGNMLLNREPSLIATKIDILTSITYPTGGTSSFEYEGNEYGKYLMPSTRAYAPGGYGKAGGLRLKKLTNSDGFGNTDVRDFFYVYGYTPSADINTLTSSGILDGKPASNHYNYSVTTSSGQYLTMYTSNGIAPLSGNSGALCGYSEVVEKYKDGSYKIFKYTNHDNGFTDHDPITNITPPEMGIPYRSRAFERGEPLGEEWYNASGQLVKKTDYTYTRIGAGADSNFVRSLRKAFGGYCTTATLLNPYIGSLAAGFQLPNMPGFIILPSSYIPNYTTGTAFGYYTYKFLNYKITVKTYGTGVASGQFVQTEKILSYDAVGNLIESSDNDSKGNTIVNKIKYPYHFAGQTVYDEMGARNMIGVPVETETILAGVTIGKDKTNYDFFNSNVLIKPKTVTRQNGSSTPYTIIQFNRYDEKGNILEFENNDGIKNSFLWSYFKTRPVAKIAGAEYSTVEPLVSQQVLTYPSGGDAQLLGAVDQVRTQLGNAFVGTYLYDSKSDWGMKQSKDQNGVSTFYEYDLMGRLIRVRDNDNRIISQNEYKYKDIITYPYRNIQKSQIVYGTNCPYGYENRIWYNVPADKYGSFISQADADQKAQHEIDVNGIVYANANAPCMPIWSYNACCSYSCVYSNFSLDAGVASFSLVITRTSPGGGSGIKIGTLTGPLFLPSVNKNFSYNSGGVTGMITITQSGDVLLSGSIGANPVQITGTYTP
ncbi:MAG: DUF5977 domain-containing protein [Bacteroidetes bacterium]|nr:DUF5977 domain-containing protein [Bacteroidota bacterium]